MSANVNDFIRELVLPYAPGGVLVSWALLGLRLIFGMMLIRHGIEKIRGFDKIAPQFPDPLHIGHRRSLLLCTIAEALCPLALISGFLFRIAALALVFNMSVAVAAVRRQPGVWELPACYLVVFTFMFVTGPGTISLDRLVAGWFGLL